MGEAVLNPIDSQQSRDHEVTMRDDSRSILNQNTIIHVHTDTGANQAFALDNKHCKRKTNTDTQHKHVLLNNGLKIGSLNVCGLKHRLQYPDFTDYIHDFDLFTVLETKLDKYDVISMPGYRFIAQSRKQKYIRRSGGIGLFVKDSIAQFVNVIDSESDYIMWIKINHKLLTTKSDLVFGLVYQPPESSRFYSADEAGNLDLEITSMCIEHKYVYILGDLNGRISNIDEFIHYDEFIAKHFEFDSELTEHFNKYTYLERYNMSVKRTSMDKKTNNIGHKLLELCKLNNLFVLNGRSGTDTGKGVYTFKQCSVIDYVISSFDGLKYVSNFDITELDPLFTDGHSCLSFTLNFKVAHKPVTAPKTPAHGPRWRQNKSQAFVDNINIDSINAILTEFRLIEDNLTLATSEKIDILTDEISKIFETSASACFENTYTSRNANDKPWFGPECKRSRNAYLRSKNIHKEYPSSTNKTHLQATSREYKKTLNKHISKHKRIKQDKLRKMKQNSPKEFWKILNSIDKPSKTNEKITLETLHTFFKDLNTNSDETDNIPDMNINIDDDDEILNSKITETEIRKCASRLKSNKTPATNDNVLNEYIKYTLDKMIPIYSSLFNIILETGILPNSWLIARVH